jgi:hypothetical protein
LWPVGASRVDREDALALALALTGRLDTVDARRAAEELSGAEPGLTDAVYRYLVRHHVLPAAVRHLRAAGVDPALVRVSAETVRSTYPLNRVLPPFDPRDKEIGLDRLEPALERHLELLRAALDDVLAAANPGSIGVLSGMAYQIRAPGYVRWCNNVDVLLVDPSRLSDVLTVLCHEKGFAIHGSKLAIHEGLPLGAVKLFRIADEHEINVGLSVGRDPSNLIGIPFPDRPDERLGAVDGFPAPVATPADLLVAAAVRAFREGGVSPRTHVDVELLASGGCGYLDPSSLAWLARCRGFWTTSFPDWSP